MRSGPRKNLKRRGGAIIEMALVMPLFVLLVFGQIEMIRMGMVTQLLTTAAREGCRVAVVDQPGNDQAAVIGRIEQVLGGSGIELRPEYVSIFAGDPDAPDPNWQARTISAPDNRISVVLSVPFAEVNWLPAPAVLLDLTIRASATLSSERLAPAP